MPTLTTVIQYSLGSPSHGSQRGKGNKRNSYRKRSKTLTVCKWHVLYIENPKDSTRELLDLINEFGRVVGQKINIQKSVVVSYTNKTSEK